jgi:hypothetical protein
MGIVNPTTSSCKSNYQTITATIAPYLMYLNLHTVIFNIYYQSSVFLFKLKSTALTAMMKNEGIVYDAYTLDRWSDPDRTDMMLQQSASKAGEPWKKLWNLGTNLKQLTSGPDGNKGGIFTGKLFVNIYYLSRVYP